MWLPGAREGFSVHAATVTLPFFYPFDRIPSSSASQLPRFPGLPPSLTFRFGFSKSDIKEVTFAQRLFMVARAGEQLAAMRHDEQQKDAPFK